MSRATVSDPSRDDQEAEEENHVEHHVHAVTIHSYIMVHEYDQEDQQQHACDPILDRPRTVALLYDENYKALIDNVHNGIIPFSRDKTNANVTQFWNMRNELSLDDEIGTSLYRAQVSST